MPLKIAQNPVSSQSGSLRRLHCDCEQHFEGFSEWQQNSRLLKVIESPAVEFPIECPKGYLKAQRLVSLGNLIRYCRQDHAAQSTSVIMFAMALDGNLRRWL